MSKFITLDNLKAYTEALMKKIPTGSAGLKYVKLPALSYGYRSYKDTEFYSLAGNGITSALVARDIISGAIKPYYHDNDTTYYPMVHGRYKDVDAWEITLHEYYDITDPVESYYGISISCSGSIISVDVKEN